MTSEPVRPAANDKASPAATAAAATAARVRLLDAIDPAAEARALGLDAAIFARLREGLAGLEAAARAAAGASAAEPEA